jgi:membrane dipeptidase
MRLIDLWCNWALQYACESTQYDPGRYGAVSPRLSQIDGYLSGVGATVLACGREPDDWAAQADPWSTLGEMIARYEAEFPGRLLIQPEDVARWESEPEDFIAWGMLGVAGFDALVRTSTDLGRLPALFERGVRVFQLVASGASALGGSAEAGDDRGLTDLGRAFLDHLDRLAPRAESRGPRPVVDASAMNDRTLADVLSWFEERGSTSVLLVRSHGGDLPTAESLARFRRIGGLIGLTPGAGGLGSAESFRHAVESVAAVPFQGRPGNEGIGIGSDFLGRDHLPPELAGVAPLVEWLGRTLGDEVLAPVARVNARGLFVRAAGAD